LTTDRPSTLRLSGAQLERPAEGGEPLRLRTLRMTLRYPEPSDREAFLRTLAASRDALQAHCPIHREDEDDAAVFDRLLGRNGDAASGHTSIRLLGVLDDGRVVGGFNLIGVITGLERKATVNWWVSPELANQGLATEGVAALLGHALTDAPPYSNGLGLHSIEAWITGDNAASVRIAEKTGFKKSAKEPEYLSLGDRWVMHNLYVRRVDDLE
jgi:ribosomal-protein-alanine N-acetyltransferase